MKQKDLIRHLKKHGCVFFNPVGIKYQYDGIYKDAAINKPAGANACTCIGLRLFKLKRNAYNLPALVSYCEYVRLVPKK